MNEEERRGNERRGKEMNGEDVIRRLGDGN